MAATPDPSSEPSIALATFVAARMDDVRELVELRMDAAELQRKHDNELRAVEHKQLLDAVTDLHNGLGKIRDRHDGEIKAIAERVDVIESEIDKNAGGRAHFKDRIAYITAAIGTLVGLRGLHIL